MADDKALTDEQRATRLSELGAAILDSWRSYVAAVDASGGSYVATVDPRAWLGISGPAPRAD
jgi:hypothetical protein